MDNTQRELSFGEKAVGLNFNPGNDPKVQEVKESYAKIIDTLNDEREKLSHGDESTGESREKIRMISIAITELQTSQMWAVKAITYRA